MDTDKSKAGSLSSSPVKGSAGNQAPRLHGLLDYEEVGVQALPTDSAARKNIPLVRGVLDYFPAALAAVAEVSKKGNDKHNPGEELHHSRGKSSDHADCILRHLVDRGTVDPDDGQRHSAKMAWRALALLQEELEAAGAPLARGARLPAPPDAVRNYLDHGLEFAKYACGKSRCDAVACVPCSQAKGHTGRCDCGRY